MNSRTVRLETRSLLTFLAHLKTDPLPVLLESGDEALVHFVKRDLLEVDPGPIANVWSLPEVRKLLAKQRDDGSWKYSGNVKDVYPRHHYFLFETWRRIRFLVQRYGMTREHSALERAAEFLFMCQSPEGDIRGLLANQYAPYYTGAILGLLVEAGYGQDPRVEKGIRWLIDVRQKDGGWAAPIQIPGLSRKEQYRLTTEYAEPLGFEPDRPSAHNVTGMALRAVAAHPRHRRLAPAKKAARLLASRFFQDDRYTSYRSAGYWVRFHFPFWWNNLVAALDTVSRIGIRPEDPGVRAGLDWLERHQRDDGLWDCTYVPGKRMPRNAKTESERRWISLAVCRMWKRFVQRTR